MPTFDLLTERWIPIVRIDGTSDEVGLREALLSAHEIAEIRDPMPTVEFGLYRLLVALTIDIFELREVSELADLLHTGEFAARRVEAYLGQWHDRFDLFHPKHPFLQMAAMAGEEKPLAALLPVVPSGTNAIHFYHQPEGSFGIAPAIAARLLTAVAPFMTAGGAGLSPSICGAPPWYVLVFGRSLLETLCLNRCAVPLSTSGGDAPPAWRDPRALPAGRARQASLVEAMSWRPRRIQFIPGPAGVCAITGAHTPDLVSTMRFAAGLSCDFTWMDPGVAYRMAGDKIIPFRPREGREVWRDTGALALLQQADYESDRGGKVRFERPALVTQFGLMVRDGMLGDRHDLELVAYGLRTDLKMKVFEWQRATLSLPAPLVWKSAFRAEAQRAIDAAESVAYHLDRAAKLTYPRQGSGNRAAFDSRIASAQRQFWSDLRPDYDRLLQQLADLPDEGYDAALAACLATWNERLRVLGWRALSGAIGDLDTDADALARMVNARDYFAARLRHLSASPAEKEAANRKETRGRKAAPANPTKGGATQ